MAEFESEAGTESSSANWLFRQVSAGFHVQLIHPERGEYTFAFHESDEIGPVMLAKISKKTGLKAEDL
jgi:predicted RNA binding protein YcfA (HicA-like mRNA interferase family)